MNREVTATIGQELLTTVQAGPFVLQSDEPEELGGQGLAPDPYHYVLVGLATCTAITLRMYANHKQWPLEKVEVKASMKESISRATPHHMYVTFQAFGPLTEEQLRRLEDVAAKCPVHRSLKMGFEVSTRLEPVS